MSILTVPGAHLYHEVEGSGPLLLLIPGASGTGDSFRPLTSSLSAGYQVVIYDRRGFSRSHLDGPADDDRRLEMDADDVRRLIEHLTDQPATVFGNSSGAIVALEVLTRSPEHVQMLVAHEPPAVKQLPDAAVWMAFFDGVYDTYRTEGIPQAMHQFAHGVLGIADRKVLERAQNAHPDLSNTRYWLEHELRTYPRVELDLDALATQVERLVLAGGSAAHTQMTYQPGKVLAERLGIELLDMPGGHLGFLSSPVAFARALLDALGGGSR